MKKLRCSGGARPSAHSHLSQPLSQGVSGRTCVEATRATVLIVAG
jgi:hypothetical protein